MTSSHLEDIRAMRSLRPVLFLQATIIPWPYCRCYSDMGTDEQPRHSGRLGISRCNEALLLEYSEQSPLPGLGESSAAFQNLSQARADSSAAGRATNRGGRAFRDLRTSALLVGGFCP